MGQGTFEVMMQYLRPRVQYAPSLNLFIARQFGPHLPRRGLTAGQEARSNSAGGSEPRNQTGPKRLLVATDQSYPTRSARITIILSVATYIGDMHYWRLF